MGRVFVIQATRNQPDVSPASSYGNIVFMLTVGDRSSVSPAGSFKKLFAILENFDPEHDFLLWSGGDPLSCMMVGIVMAELNIRKYNYLRYERPDPRKSGSAGYYVPIKVDFDS